MFTGIIEEVGTIRAITSNKITVICSKVVEDTNLGDSIAVEGVCLTVTDIGKDYFSADISQETFNVTNLKNIKIGEKVNLERALLLSQRLGGHIVSGHIDTVGKIINIEKLDEFYNYTVEFDNNFEKYTVKKGSIAINGTSLTVAKTEQNRVTIAIIPHTCLNTSLHSKKIGDNVNLEFDIISKYIEKILLSKDNENITDNLLTKCGFC